MLLTPRLTKFWPDFNTNSYTILINYFNSYTHTNWSGLELYNKEGKRRIKLNNIRCVGVSNHIFHLFLINLRSHSSPYYQYGPNYGASFLTAFNHSASLRVSALEFRAVCFFFLIFSDICYFPRVNCSKSVKFVFNGCFVNENGVQHISDLLFMFCSKSGQCSKFTGMFLHYPFLSIFR